MTRHISEVENLRENFTFFLVGAGFLKIFGFILAEFGVQKELRSVVGSRMHRVFVAVRFFVIGICRH